MLLQQIHSKEDDFDIASGGFATFYYDSSLPSTHYGIKREWEYKSTYTNTSKTKNPRPKSEVFENN
ncbi:MAG: hypothetical protein K0B10_12590 [Vicingaceae bacterium]|nr:hypothetical protein [Vicingaceae bacterium]